MRIEKTNLTILEPIVVHVLEIVEQIVARVASPPAWGSERINKNK